MRPVSKKRLSDQIIEQIVSSINNGKLKIGSKLPPEMVLTRQFRVGRSSIREAKRALILTGVLDETMGRGTYVAAYPDSLLNMKIKTKTNGTEKVRHFFEARIALEEAVVALAAKYATDSDISDLHEALEDLRKARKGTEKFVQADLAFHLKLARASHNDVLYRFLNGLRPLMRAWTEQATKIVNDRHINLARDKHAEILGAIEEKNGEKARFLMRDYLEKSSQGLTPRLIQKQLSKANIVYTG